MLIEAIKSKNKTVGVMYLQTGARPSMKDLQRDKIAFLCP